MSIKCEGPFFVLTYPRGGREMVSRKRKDGKKERIANQRSSVKRTLPGAGSCVTRGLSFNRDWDGSFCRVDRSGARTDWLNYQPSTPYSRCKCRKRPRTPPRRSCARLRRWANAPSSHLSAPSRDE